MTKKVLAEAGINYTAMDANENQELIHKYGILHAPTLVVAKDNGIEKFAGIVSVKAFISRVQCR